MSKSMRIRLTAAAVSLVAAVALAGCGADEHHAASVRKEPVVAETRIATIQEIPTTTEATGSVEPWVRVSPGTKIMGRVESLSVREGDRVRAGQVLARLEDRDLQASIEQARAAQQMAEARLINARSHHERMIALHQKGSVTEKNLEDALAAFLVAQAGVEQARANLAAAEVTASYAEIRSPVAGWVTAKRIEVGDMASPGAPLFRIEDLSRVKVTLSLPESGVVGLSAKDKARVAVDVLGRSWDAEVDRVNPAGDPKSRTYEVQLVLANPEGLLKSGMFARAWFERGARSALIVPDAALVHRGQLDGLFVVGDDSVARLRWVRLGRPGHGGTEVLSGLDAGERFVATPPPGFADGTPVSPR